MTDPTEAPVLDALKAVERMALVNADCSPSRESLRAYAEAVRATEREKVRAAFQDLLDVAEDMLPYVPEYFREKWGHDEGVERARLWLARDEVPE